MKHLILIPLALFSLSSLPACAEDMHMNMNNHAAAQSHEGSGTVNSVDAKASKINLTHGPIASLDWPGMTMDFEVQDKAVLSNLKPGQKVKFKLVEPRHGKYVISEITVAK
jgi:Cu(I)/Ag(I) efflux system membrane fusion protein